MRYELKVFFDHYRKEQSIIDMVGRNETTLVIPNGGERRMTFNFSHFKSAEKAMGRLRKAKYRCYITDTKDNVVINKVKGKLIHEEL